MMIMIFIHHYVRSGKFRIDIEDALPSEIQTSLFTRVCPLNASFEWEFFNFLLTVFQNF